MDFKGQRESTNVVDDTKPGLKTRIGEFLFRHGITNDAAGHPYGYQYAPPLAKPGGWPDVRTPEGKIQWDKPSQAGIDLGMGAELQKQTMDQVLERRQRTMLAANQTAPAFGALAMGSGTTGAGNTGGMALKALMGAGVAGG